MRTPGWIKILLYSHELYHSPSSERAIPDESGVALSVGIRYKPVTFGPQVVRDTLS
jgi:hypothetical protein